MKIVFDFPSSFFSDFRMGALTLKNENSSYGIEMKLPHSVKPNKIFLCIHIRD